MKTQSSEMTRKMVQMAILIAIMLVFAFTPLGYLPIGPLSITLMCVPVAIGAIVTGPTGGAVLGLVFGLTSFVQCFGKDPFGTFLFGQNPFGTFVMCIVARVLCGWLSGLIFKGMQKIDKTKIVSYYVASLSTALLNTLFFMGFLVIFFWHNQNFIGQMNEWGMNTEKLMPFLVAFVGLNGVVEAAVNFILGGTIAKILKVAKLAK
ncbi:MAG: ECF transporter S component [Clostridia bacterium]|nr:ECF transporter S component [Clostridia bacterium]